MIDSNWSPGWLMYFDDEIRPDKLSRRLLRDLVVMSAHLKLFDCNKWLGERTKGVRVFTCADVKDVCTQKCGRLWGELRREAFEVGEKKLGVKAEEGEEDARSTKA